jgi:hypothetical protein
VADLVPGAGPASGPAGESHRQPDRDLLANLHTHLDELAALQAACDRYGDADDLVYRFWHQSFKVYGLQDLTERIAGALAALCPAGGKLNPWFADIVATGTNRTFDLSHNRAWVSHTRPIVDAYLHARYLLDLAVRCGRELDVAPSVLPSGWATLLYLYQIR